MLRLHKTSVYLRETAPRRLLRCSFIIAAFFALCTFAAFLTAHLVSNNEHQVTFITRTQCTSPSNHKNEAAAKLEHEMMEVIPDDQAFSTWIDDSVWRNLPVKGVFYMIAENHDLQSARASMRSVEDRFNRQFGYPWVILSSRYISPEFRKYITMVTDAPVYFGKIDLEAWEPPHWVNADLAEAAMQSLDARGVRHGSSLSFRQRARYHAGFYFHHPLMQNVDYSWRVEPGSYYSCDLVDDPFFQMKSQNKTVGFVLTARGQQDAVNNLWPITRQFIKLERRLLLNGTETIVMWLFDADTSFNYCHIQSSFQIINMAFLRSPRYKRYFNFIDSSGGFFYERWDEGSVLTMAASLFLRKNELHFFNQMGFEYGGLTHCPMSLKDYPRCSCDIAAATDFNMDSCTLNLLQLMSPDTIEEIAQYTRARLNNEAGRTDFMLQRLART